MNKYSVIAIIGLSIACSIFGDTIVLKDDYSFGTGDRASITNGAFVDGNMIQQGGVLWNYANVNRKMVFQTVDGKQVMGGILGKGGGQMAVSYDLSSAVGTVTASVNTKLTAMMMNAYTPGFSISFTTATSDLSVNAKTSDALSMRFNPFDGLIQVRTGYSSDPTVNPVNIGGGYLVNYDPNNIINIALSYNIASGYIKATATDTVTGGSYTFTKTLAEADRLNVANMNTVALEVTTFDTAYAGTDYAYFDDFQVSVIPEPATLSLMVIGCAVAFGIRAR